MFAHTKPETELKPALRAQLNETVFVRKKRSVCFLISIFLNPELVNLLQGRSSVPVFGSYDLETLRFVKTCKNNFGFGQKSVFFANDFLHFLY